MIIVYYNNWQYFLMNSGQQDNVIESVHDILTIYGCFVTKHGCIRERKCTDLCTNAHTQPIQEGNI